MKTIAIILVIIIVIGAGIGIYFAVRPASADIANGKTIVLDPGHGGRDGGVIGSTGIRESDINLAIALAAERFLLEKGYTVVLTRRNSDGLYAPTDQNKKMADMNRRRQIIEEARPDLVVSIHQNSFPGASVRGPRVFYAKGSEDGKAVAEHVQSSMNNALVSSAPAAVGDYFILEKTQFTSILIECGFLTNPEEERLLATTEYQQKLGFVIFFAIHTLLNDASMTGIVVG
ncbi:MAG: N-acetylmuramoyl-L-alanine amidase [Firmicutes bacterium]|nr:N-acetylmuramoyl-L-alanine amidase [Bacillota bacterium]